MQHPIRLGVRHTIWPAIVLAVDQNQPSGGLLVAEETYNWPNPATDHTHLRFMTTAAAEVSSECDYLCRSTRLRNPPTNPRHDANRCADQHP